MCHLVTANANAYPTSGAHCGGSWSSAQTGCAQAGATAKSDRKAGREQGNRREGSRGEGQRWRQFVGKWGRRERQFHRRPEHRWPKHWWAEFHWRWRQHRCGVQQSEEQLPQFSTLQLTPRQAISSETTVFGDLVVSHALLLPLLLSLHRL